MRCAMWSRIFFSHQILITRNLTSLRSVSRRISRCLSGREKLDNLPLNNVRDAGLEPATPHSKSETLSIAPAALQMLCALDLHTHTSHQHIR